MEEGLEELLLWLDDGYPKVCCCCILFSFSLILLDYDKQVLLSGFDQEAATAVMARLILHKQIKEDFNIVK